MRSNTDAHAVNGPPPPGQFNDQDQSLAIARHMLHDPASGSIEERAVACLVLLSAQPVSKIAQLTIGDVHTNERGRTSLKLGPVWLELAPPLDAIITALPIKKPFGAANVLADKQWLFPGRNAGHHIHPSTLKNALNLHGIQARASRNTALLHLAATTPPAVFADLLGLSIGKAVRWAEIAGGNWMTYAAVKQPRQRR